MSRGDIYSKHGRFLLQMNEPSNGLVPFTFIKDYVDAQQVPGCDVQEPYFFVRRTPRNALPHDGFIFLGRNAVCLLPLAQVSHISFETQGSLASELMHKIVDCAKHHGWIPQNLLDYF